MDLVKRCIVIAVIAGLGVLAIFIASEMNNIIATSDKAILFVMPGVPIAVGLVLLMLLDWERYFAFSMVLFCLLSLFVFVLAALDGMSLRAFYNLLTRVNPDFGRGMGGGYALELTTKSALATAKGTLYFLTIATLVLFVGYGAYRGLAPLADGAVPAPAPRPEKRRSYKGIVAAVVLFLLVLTGLAFVNYTNDSANRRAAEQLIRVETAPAAASTEASD